MAGATQLALHCYVPASKAAKCNASLSFFLLYVPYMVQVPLKRLGQGEEVWQGVKFVIECDYFTGTAYT